MDQKIQNHRVARPMLMAGVMHAGLILTILVVGLFVIPKWKAVMADFDIAIPIISTSYLTLTEPLLRNGWLATFFFTILLTGDMASMLLMYRNNKDMVRYWSWGFIAITGAWFIWRILALTIPFSMLLD